MGTRGARAPGTNASVSARVRRESRLAVADRFAEESSFPRRGNSFESQRESQLVPSVRLCTN